MMSPDDRQTLMIRTAFAVAMALGAAIWVAIVTLSWVLAIVIAILGTAIVLKLWEIAGGTPACPRPPKLPPPSCRS